VKYVLSRLRIALNRFVIKHLKFPTPFCLVGAGSASTLCEHIAASSICKVLLVTDKGILNATLLDPLLVQLEQQGVTVSVYSDVSPDPDYDSVLQGVQRLENSEAAAVIAIGGGSSIDCAKAIVYTSANRRHPSALTGLWLYALPRKRGVPLYVIPTTAGTGSEVTIAAVLSDHRAQTKKAIIDPKLLPVMVALDANLTLGLPLFLTACTGMDALTHAVEAFISTMAQPETDRMARVASKLILSNLPKVVDDGTNTALRQNMLYASCLAGMSFTRAGVGYVHAFAHQLGALYKVPHGLANAMMLAPVLELMKHACEAKLALLAIDANFGQVSNSDAANAELFIAHIKWLCAALHIPEKIQQLQLDDIDTIIGRAFSEAHGTYAVPCYLTKEQARSMLKALVV